MPDPSTSGAPILAAGVAVVTLALILLRPRGLPELYAALGGAAATLLLGLVTPSDAVQAVAGSWNVFLFFIGLMVSSFTAERAGVFDVAAGLVARLAGGSARRLLVWVYLLGVLVTAFLSNDATALLLTPVVFTLARRLELPPLPYAYACALSANAASFILPVSNPANLLVMVGAPMTLATFVERLWLPSLLSAGVTLLGLLALAWGALGQRYHPPRPEPIGRRAWLGTLGLAVLVAAYLLSDLLRLPLGAVACGGALLLVLLDACCVRPSLPDLAREVPWSVLALLAGLNVVVEALVHSGVTAPATGLLGILAEPSGPAGALGPAAVGLGTALLSNAINNLPMALVTAAALHGLDPAAADRLVAGAIVGIDLGPNLTTVGSFATMLWLMLLRRRGIDISAWAYARVGLLVTPPALLAALGGLLLAR
ncbi:MAG: arsenic transporter [Chloroflexi bacterium]|nr:arsenic transporter [Chloroflexota bacterium]